MASQLVTVAIESKTGAVIACGLGRIIILAREDLIRRFDFPFRHLHGRRGRSLHLSTDPQLERRHFE